MPTMNIIQAVNDALRLQMRQQGGRLVPGHAGQVGKNHVGLRGLDLQAFDARVLGRTGAALLR